MATPIKSPHQSSDPAYLVKCLSPLPNRYPDRCMSAQIYRRPAPRRSNGFMRRRINRSLSLEILNNRSEQTSPNNQKINNDSVRHSRSAKILKALNIEYNIKSSKKSIREKLNFDGTPSSKSSSPINLRIDSNESLATSVNDTSAESIDENQNRTPSRRSTGGGGGVKKSLNYESPMNDFKALSPMLRSELKKKIDDIVLTNATPLKSIGRTRRSEPVVASTPRNLYDDLGDEDERRRIGHKKNLPGCSTDISPTLSTEMETDDSQEIPIQRTLNFSISSETHYDDEFAETGSLYDYSTVESLDDIASVAQTSKSDEVYSINSSKSEKFHSIIDDKSDNNDKQLNDNEKLCKKIKRKSESDNEECPSTPENSINYIQKIMTDSIKKSHKKVKEIHKKSLLRSQIFEKNMDNSPNIEIYDKLENSPRITRSSLKYYKNINNSVINNGKSPRKTRKTLENQRKIDISDTSESEENSKNISNENDKKIGKLLNMEIQEDESSEKPRKTRNSIGRSRENLLRPKRMEFGEENSGKLSEKSLENSGKSLEKMEMSEKSLENSGKSLEKMEMSEKSMENSEKSSDSRVGTPEQLNSSRLLLSQFDSVKKSHKKDKHRKLGFTQRNLNSNDLSNDDTNNLSNFVTPNKRTSPSNKPNDSETFNSTPISSKKSLKNTLNMIPIVRVERMADYEDELEKYETGSENDEKMENLQKSKKNSIRFSAESSPLENLESTFSSENSQKTYDTETSPSTPANSEKLDISSLSSIKKSHKKHKRISSCKRLLIETDDVDKDSDDNVEDTKDNNDEVLTTPPNTLAIKNHLRLMQSTSIKRSHKKIREKKKQDRLIFYSNLAEVKPLEEPRRRRRCLGGDK